MTTINIIGAGRVGATFLRLFERLDGVRIGDVASGSLLSAQAAVTGGGAGRAVELADMSPADIWLITVPDDRISDIAAQISAPPAIAVHCSGFKSSDALASLADKGWKSASCHPVRSFADPDAAANAFAGTYCAIEGTAAPEVSDLLQRIGGVPFDVLPERKAIYHAAAVFSNNFTTVIQQIALDAWREAGVDQDTAMSLCASLLTATAENVVLLGPQLALTGPAARGDTQVLAEQQAALAAWEPRYAKLYEDFSAMARALKSNGSL